MLKGSKHRYLEIPEGRRTPDRTKLVEVGTRLTRAIFDRSLTASGEAGRMKLGDLFLKPSISPEQALCWAAGYANWIWQRDVLRVMQEPCGPIDAINIAGQQYSVVIAPADRGLMWRQTGDELRICRSHPLLTVYWTWTAIDYLWNLAAHRLLRERFTEPLDVANFSSCPSENMSAGELSPYLNDFNEAMRKITGDHESEPPK